MGLVYWVTLVSAEDRLLGIGNLMFFKAKIMAITPKASEAKARTDL